MTFTVCCKSAQARAFMFFQAGCWLWPESCLAAGTPLVLVIFDTCQTDGAVLALAQQQNSALCHTPDPQVACLVIQRAPGGLNHCESQQQTVDIVEGVEQSFDSFYSLCLNVCFVFITMSHAAVCLVKPIFTFYNIMGIWLKYIQLGWSYHFVVSITTWLTKFEGLVVYLFVWWCMTWFSSVATAFLLLFRGTLRFGSWVI